MQKYTLQHGKCWMKMKTNEQIIKDFHKSKDTNFITYLNKNPVEVKELFKRIAPIGPAPRLVQIEKPYHIKEEIMEDKLGPYIAIDFEYRKSNEPRLDLICAALTDGTITKSIWLHNNPENKAKLKKYLLGIRDTHTLIVWSYDAEGRSLVSLGLNPVKFKCIDVQAEYRMLTNHNDKLGYGEQFIDGKIIKTFRKQYGVEDKKRHDRTPTNLLAARFKLLKLASIEEYKRKNEMRDICIYNESFSTEEQNEILDYCESDIAELKDIYDAEIKHYRKLLNKKEFELLHDEQLYRGETVARAAVMASIGYPVDRKQVVNFTRNIPALIKECQEDINRQFPDKNIFRKLTKKAENYSLNTIAVKRWVE